MADEQNSTTYKYEDELDVVRRQNRALRSVNRSLHKRLTRSNELADSYFVALCYEEQED